MLKFLETVRCDNSEVCPTALYDKTLCPDYLSTIGDHYHTHSLYGPGQAEPTLEYVYIRRFYSMK